MNRVLRIALTWLLLVAVPLQGYAAGGMLFCGGGERPGSASPHDHGRHAPEAGASDHHRAAADVVDLGDAWNLHDVMHGKCSACASCCGVAALPTAPIACGAESPRALATVASEIVTPDRGAARLERPPRLILA